MSTDPTEPEIFEQWSWFSLSELPGNIFPASDVMIRLWKENKLPEGWAAYSITSQGLKDSVTIQCE